MTGALGSLDGMLNDGEYATGLGQFDILGTLDDAFVGGSAVGSYLSEAANFLSTTPDENHVIPVGKLICK